MRQTGVYTPNRNHRRVDQMRVAGRKQPNDQRLVMTVNVGNITPSATYNKGRVLIVVVKAGSASGKRGNKRAL